MSHPAVTSCHSAFTTKLTETRVSSVGGIQLSHCWDPRLKETRQHLKFMSSSFLLFFSFLFSFFSRLIKCLFQGLEISKWKLELQSLLSWNLYFKQRRHSKWTKINNSNYICLENNKTRWWERECLIDRCSIMMFNDNMTSECIVRWDFSLEVSHNDHLRVPTG